nr:hypothetical protein [Moraxella sp. CTOTU48717]
MDEAQIQRIINHSEFQSMAKRKTSLGLIPNPIIKALPNDEQ